MINHSELSIGNGGRMRNAVFTDKSKEINKNTTVTRRRSIVANRLFRWTSQTLWGFGVGHLLNDFAAGFDSAYGMVMVL